jgi:hypothetical protein
LFDRKRSKTAAVSLTALERMLVPSQWAALANEFKKIKVSISAEFREAGVCWSIGADLSLSAHNLTLIGASHNDRSSRLQSLNS